MLYLMHYDLPALRIVMMSRCCWTLFGGRRSLTSRRPSHSRRQQPTAAADLLARLCPRQPIHRHICEMDRVCIVRGLRVPCSGWQDQIVVIVVLRAPICSAPGHSSDQYSLSS